MGTALPGELAFSLTIPSKVSLGAAADPFLSRNQKEPPSSPSAENLISLTSTTPPPREQKREFLIRLPHNSIMDYQLSRYHSPFPPQPRLKYGEKTMVSFRQPQKHARTSLPVRQWTPSYPQTNTHVPSSNTTCTSSSNRVPLILKRGVSSCNRFPVDFPDNPRRCPTRPTCMRTRT